VCFAVEDAIDGGFGVVACCNTTTRGFDGGNGRGGGAGDSDVDWLSYGYGGAIAGKEFYAVFDAVEAAGLEEFAQCERVGGTRWRKAAIVEES